MFRIYFILFISLFFISSMTSNADEYFIYNGEKLTEGYNLGINTSNKRTDWHKDNGKELVIDYPSEQDWGAVFITYGSPTKVNNQKLFKNLSMYTALEINKIKPKMEE